MGHRQVTQPFRPVGYGDGYGNGNGYGNGYGNGDGNGYGYGNGDGYGGDGDGDGYGDGSGDGTGNGGSKCTLFYRHGSFPEWSLKLSGAIGAACSSLGTDCDEGMLVL
jgi:hypothetical protein